MLILRAGLVVCLPMLLAACANENSAGQLLPTSALAAGYMPDIAPSELPKKTMSDRVLAAIALERVTGLKPDPARFSQD